MSKRVVFLVLAFSLLAMGLLLTAEITRATEAPRLSSELYAPTKTPRPTRTPRPTNTPKPTNTPRPTSTPNIQGTQGVIPTAIQGPPPGIGGGVGSLDSPGSLLVDPLVGKMFVASGFPGVSTGLDDQGYYQYAKNRKSGPTLWATWYIQVPQSGYYDLYAYIPTNPNPTKSAQYHVFQNDVPGPALIVDQSLYAGQWVNLGSYYLVQDSVGTQQYVTLDNQTQEDDTTTVVLCSTLFAVFRP
jgi:hypothetical protein